MRDEPDPLDPPEETLGDKVLPPMFRGLATVSTGGLGTQLFDWVVGEPIKRRLGNWRAEVAEMLRRLEKELGVIAAKLRENEQFISMLVQASQSAVKTHNEVKLESLRNAVANSALTTSLSEAKQGVFMSWIDSFSPLHISALKFLQKPPRPGDRVQFGGDNILDRWPDQADRPLLDGVVADLKSAKLTWLGGSRQNESHSHKTGYTTVLGDEFLLFITDPLPPAGP